MCWLDIEFLSNVDVGLLHCFKSCRLFRLCEVSAGITFLLLLLPDLVVARRWLIAGESDVASSVNVQCSVYEFTFFSVFLMERGREGWMDG